MSSTHCAVRMRTAARRGGRALPLLALGLLAIRGSVAAQGPDRERGLSIAAVPAIVTLGAVPTAEVQIRNEGTVPAQLRLYLGDFEQDVNGGYSFIPFGKGGHSCGSALSYFPNAAALLPGERQQIQVRLAPGAGVCWGLLFVESLPQGRGPVKIVQRIGIKLLNVPPGATSAGEVGTVDVRRLRGDTLRVKAIFQNTGQAPLQLKGRVEIRDFTGKVFLQGEFGPFGSLPGRGRTVEVTIAGRLAPGDYVAVPIVDFGGDYLAGGQGVFHVK